MGDSQPSSAQEKVQRLGRWAPVGPSGLKSSHPERGRNSLALCESTRRVSVANLFVTKAWLYMDKLLSLHVVRHVENFVNSEKPRKGASPMTKENEQMKSQHELLVAINQKAVSDVHKVATKYPKLGNPELSLVGKKWFYLGEDDRMYYLHFDEIVYLDEHRVGITMNIDTEEGLVHPFPHPFFLTHNEYIEMYPVHELFPDPLRTMEEADAILQEKCND